MEYPELVWREDAVDRVSALRGETLDSHGVESVALDRIGGRVLAEAITADADSPPVSRATMDGYAIEASAGYPVSVQGGEVFPEDDPGDLESGHAQEIATGAPLPAGADTVVKREDVTVEDGELTGPELASGTYVYERGRNYRAGETLFAAGERLGARDAILLGDVGVDSVPVFERFSAGVVATGTEIHQGRTRDLDSPMLAGLIESWGHSATYEGSAPDEYERVRDLLETTAEEYDVVVSTGGTSVGHKDHVITALQDLGEILFHKVRIRPGKPIAFARLPDYDAVAVAIPGKPIGAHVIATMVMAPYFTGDRPPYPTVSATCRVDVGLGPDGFEYVIPVTLTDGEVTPLGHNTSPLSVYEDTFDPSVLSSSTRTSRADGVVVTTDPLDAGDHVDVIPYDVLE